MSRRTLWSVLCSMVGVAGALAASLVMALPRLAALPHGVSPGTPPWALAAPAIGTAIPLALLLLRSRALRRGAPATTAADLPVQIVVTFTIAALATLLAGLLLGRDALTVHRPAVVVVCGPALVLVHGLVLRVLVQPILAAEVSRLAAAAETPERGRTFFRRAIAGALAMRPSVTLVTALLVGVALALICGHTYAIAQYGLESQGERHLANLLHVASVQLARMPADRARAHLEAQLPSDEGTLVLVDRGGRILTPKLGLPEGRVLRRAEASGTCTVGGQTVRCALDATRGIAALGSTSAGPEALTGLATHLALVAAFVFGCAVLLGWAVGHDISRDFRTIANHIRAMAREDQLNLGRPVTVTSIDEVGELTAAVGHLRKRLEQELAAHQSSLKQVREADRTKNDFLCNVSQELRTPLTSVNGFAQLLVDGSEGPLASEQLEDVRSIHRGGQQLLALVNDVLDIAVIESGTLHLAPEPVDVGQLCGELVEIQRGARRALEQPSPVSLVLEVEAQLPRVQADPRRLTQVVQNLLSNALKFTREGLVTLRVRRSPTVEAMIEIAIQDTGVGISQLELPRIFERYRQAGDLLTRRQGAGLGLAICKHLVQLHGGTIAVESAIGQGSTFTVAIPVSGPPSPGRPA